MRRILMLLTGFTLLIGLAACSTLPSGAPATSGNAAAASATSPATATATPQPPTATATAIPATATPAGPTATPGPAPTFARIKMIDAKNGWATTNGDNGGLILHTNDGGSTWVDVTPVNTPNLVNSYGAFFLDAKTAWTFAGDLSQPDRGSGKVLRTSDGGSTWQPFDAPFTTGNLTFIDSQNGWMRADPNCGAGNCYIKVFNTTDGGETWNLLPVANPYGSENNITAGTIHEISGDDIDFTGPKTLWFGGNVLVSATTAVFYVSRDGGQTWKKVELPLPAGADISGAPVKVDLPVFVDPLDAFLAAKYQLANATTKDQSSAMVVYTSHDGGQTWQALPNPVSGVDSFTQMDILSAKDAFVRCANNLCVTHDGAQTWQMVTSNLSFNPNDTNSISGLDFVDATTGWAIVTDGTTYHLYQTVDGGVTWKELAVTVTVMVTKP